ncbi:phage portal protein [Salinicoccus albus]|uniref:phage portal protein n=1 Tax=Salinicoccus albus TaxID=418756 RepID=UPI0003816BFE|nr:phage portal protein [Salinicoccus albus]
MDPFTKPHGEQLTDFAKPKDESQTEMLMRLIKENAPNIEIYKTGQRYYDNHPDLKDERKPTDHEGNIDYSKPDWRFNHNPHANLVDQKVGYIVGESPNYQHEDDAVISVIEEYLDYDFDDDLNDILTAASNKGVEWVHPYVDEEGLFKVLEIPAEQIIPIWKDRKQRILQAIIRHYTVGDEQRVEYWTADDVTYYIKTHSGLELSWYHGMNESNPTTHLTGESWGKVPFIPFKNNSQSASDIWRYKLFIDAMNRRSSDTQNMFDESTELIYILKGYEGTDLSEFMQNLKYYKAINVDSEGGVETIRVEVPVTSSNEWLEQLRKYIYDYGRGVDFNRNELGNSPSGIALRFLYTGLDLKTKQLARKTIPAIKQLLWFIFEFENMDGSIANEVDVTFNYNRMVNELEQANIASMSSSIISDETVIANHPWVDDLEKEKERIKEQDERLNTDLPIKGVEDDELQ